MYLSREDSEKKINKLGVPHAIASTLTVYFFAK